MAEETNNQPLTAREVAAANPELDKLRQIAFGENYLDDIDAGTGTARFYSGFGMQPDYLGTAAATEQAVADAVTAEAEAAAAPVIETGGEDQVTGGLTDNTPFEQDLIDEGAGVQVAPGQPVVAPGEIPITQQEIDEYNLNTPFEQNLINQGVGVQIEPGAPVGAQGERFDDSPLSVSQQADIASQTNFGLDYNQLDQEGQREIDEQIKATPDITPATSINFNPLKTAANIITGGLTDIPFVGTAVRKAADYFKGGEDGSVASKTDFSTMGDTGVDAEENQPTNIQTPLETAIGINQDPMTGDAQIAEEIALSNQNVGETSSDSGFSSSDEGETSSDSGFSSSDEGETSSDAGFSDPVDDPTDRGGGGGGGGSSGGGGGCVIATHAVDSGAFTPETKREAVRWCIKNLHRTWWGEAVRRGYRYYGQKAIDEGKAKNHYQEFKDYVAFGTGRKRTLKTAWTFVYRTIQFFIKGITIKNAKR